jgi:peptide/nickel transport system ATP-binding protein
MIETPILEVKDLSVSFSQYTRGLRRKTLQVISDLDIELYAGKIVAVVGASGSGKSLLAHAILNLLPENAQVKGTFYYKGEKITSVDQCRLRGKEWVLIPQSVNYLDPLMKVKKQIEITMDATEVKDGLVSKWLKKYGLSKSVDTLYPHQLSGGMARKVLLTTALSAHPKVIIADEPTPGLDAASLDAVLKDFRDLANMGCAILMITHDISAALRIADQIAIFYAGTTVEVANVSDFENQGHGLRHPYTKALFEALPEQAFKVIEGTQPTLEKRFLGCIFESRCDEVGEHCRIKQPPYQTVRGGKVKCYDAT